MQIVLPRSWKEEFAAAAAKREDMRYAEKMVRFYEQQRERREEEKFEDERRDAEFITTAEIILATSEEIAAFRVELDEYDVKTVEALMENREALESVRERIDAMLEEAYVLPDGRKVFKTRDGTQVFDEHGQALSPDVIDPATIDDRKTRWEPFKAATDEHVRLTKEREQLLTYQAKLDEARERLDKGDITHKELESLKADLAEDMPDAVRAKLGLQKPRAAGAPTQETKSVAIEATMPPDMDDLMRGTGFGPSGP